MLLAWHRERGGVREGMIRAIEPSVRPTSRQGLQGGASSLLPQACECFAVLLCNPRTCITGERLRGKVQAIPLTRGIDLPTVTAHCNTVGQAQAHS